MRHDSINNPDAPWSPSDRLIEDDIVLSVAIRNDHLKRRIDRGVAIESLIGQRLDERLDWVTVWLRSRLARIGPGLEVLDLNRTVPYGTKLEMP
jgi:hypothetical protein